MTICSEDIVWSDQTKLSQRLYLPSLHNAHVCYVLISEIKTNIVFMWNMIVLIVFEGLQHN